MSNYGLEIRNPTGQLVLSSAARGLYCLGKASQYFINQSSGTSGTFTGKDSGVTKYRFTTPGPIIVAIDLPDGHYVGAIDLVEISTGVWEITLVHGTSLDSEGFITTQSYVDVWVYGVVPGSTPLGSYGLAIYNAAGDLTWDLTQPNPLFIQKVLTAAAGVGFSTFTLPALSRPVVIGFPYMYQYLDERIGANTHHITVTRGVFKRTGSSLESTFVTTHKHQFFGPEDPVGNTTDINPIMSMIVEGANLP